MSINNTNSNVRYTAPAIALHWLMAWLIIAVYFLGLSIDALPVGPDRIQVVGWHKWLGVTIAFLWGFRVLWRAGHRPPALPASSPAWQNAASHLVHVALYLLMIAIPVSGWLMSSAKGYTTNFFGLFDLPNLLMKDKELGHTLKEVHEVLANSLMALVGLHIAAALKHQLVDKDNLLGRMRPARKTK
ncbi:MAG: cytochrome b [Fluviibacter sp.]